VGYDAGKRVKGRKIHALVDSEGLPMRIVVHSAEIQDRDGAALVLDNIRRRFPWLELICADGGYNAWQVDVAVAKVPRLRLEIVKRSDDIKGFVVLPRRWVVERTLSWFGRNRRLAKDFENLAETLATFVTIASIQLALRRLTRGVGPDAGRMMAPAPASSERPVSDRSADLCRSLQQ
jgi:transposase